jgi:hypothetical protein
MNDGKLTIDLSGVGNDIPTKLGKSRPTLTHGVPKLQIPFWDDLNLRRSD